jgi:SAM-dependent methyltransferase
MHSMPDDPEGTLKAKAAYSGDPWVPGNEYFTHAEPHMDPLWKHLVYPFLDGCVFAQTVDLACGHGRNTLKLLPLATALIGLDIQPGNIEVCRRRFAGSPGARFECNSGYDLRPVPDGWATLVYCFDAMVHFEPEVVHSYVADLRRVLAPGGTAFLHHSNYTGGRDWRTNPSARNYMSAEIFAGYARDAGLELLRQRTINWGEEIDLDCLSLVRQPSSSSR